MATAHQHRTRATPPSAPAASITTGTPVPTTQKLGFAFATRLSNCSVRLLARTGRGPSLPAPENEEEKEKPLASLAPDIAVVDLAKPGKKRYAKVPMTEEEEERLLDVRAWHRSLMKEARAQVERWKELLSRRDDLLFQRRCVAARLTNLFVVLRADADHVRHQRLVDWKYGMPMPEETINARNRISLAFDLYAHTCDAGLDAFIVVYRQKKRAPQQED